jgi:hypothetical protein
MDILFYCIFIFILKKHILSFQSGIKITEDDLAAIAEKYGYEFKGNEKAEFTTLLAATCNAMQFVSEMDGLFYSYFVNAFKSSLTFHRLSARA